MRQMMEGVVLPGGTGYPEARLDGYSAGGKTGSAQIFDFDTKHYTHSYNGSFMGFAPLINPAIVVVVTLNGTHGTGGFGGRAAAPVFHAIAAEALRVLDVPRDLPDAAPAPPVMVSAGGAPSAESDGDDDLSFADLADATRPQVPNVLEDADDDAASAPVEGGRPVPDFRGLTMRAAMAEAAAKGVDVQPDGSGVARVQFPPAGSLLHEGERVRVRFTR
jgi:cell division protein FtsI (penicillin-binding protein 3)